MTRHDDCEAALREAREAVDFLDRVLASPIADQISVGQDHWDRLETAARLCAAVPPALNPDRGSAALTALAECVRAWESTPPGRTTVAEIQRWLVRDMKPAIDHARSVLADCRETTT